MTFGGTRIDLDGTTAKTARFDKSFSDGEDVSFRVDDRYYYHTVFDLWKSKTWPRSYTTSILPIERDLGSLGTFLDVVAVEVASFIARKAAKAAIIGATKGIGVVLSTIVDAAVDRAVKYFYGLFSHDFFTPKFFTVQLDNADRRENASGTFSAKWREHGGTYTIWMSWKLIRDPGGGGVKQIAGKCSRCSSFEAVNLPA